VGAEARFEFGLACLLTALATLSVVQSADTTLYVELGALRACLATLVSSSPRSGCGA
jgi:hypothetical protein